MLVHAYNLEIYKYGSPFFNFLNRKIPGYLSKHAAWLGGGSYTLEFL